MPDEAVLHKDVVIALLGASATLVGLILVFLALVVGAYGALGGAVPADVKNRLRLLVVLTVIPFVLGLVQILAAAFWLLKQWGWLYDATFWLFVASVIMLAVAAAVTLWRLVWD